MTAPLFAKPDDAARRPSGELRNGWLEIAFMAAVHAIVFSWKTNTQLSLEAMWRNFQSATDPGLAAIRGIRTERFERAIHNEAENLTPENVTQAPGALADFLRAIEKMREAGS